MTAAVSIATKLPGYDLAAPSESAAIAAVERVFGPERGRALWALACGLAGVPVGQARTIELLERVTESLASQGGAAATVARSLAIRLRTHTQLAARIAATSTGAAR